SRATSRQGSIPNVDYVLREKRETDREFFYATRRDGFRDYVAAAFGGTWDDAFHRPLADREFDELPVEIVELGGEGIGYRIVVREPDHVFLDEIAIVTTMQRRGIGTHLVRAVMADAAAADLPVRLSVLDANPVRALYERLGFRITRHEPPRTKMQW